MKLYAKCNSCNKKRFFIKQRTYNIPKLGKATSQGELCYKCYKDIKTINKKIMSKMSK